MLKKKDLKLNLHFLVFVALSFSQILKLTVSLVSNI